MRFTKSDLLMASVPFAWGFSYIYIKWALECCTPIQITFLRFTIAFLLLFLVFNKKIIPTKTELIYSFFLGLMVLGFSQFYNTGLQTINASTAGFLAGTTVVMVPIINSILKGKLPEKKVIFCAVLVMCGISFMSLSSEFKMAIGSVLCLCGALSYAIYIIVTDRAISYCRALVIGIWQLGFTALFSAAGVFFTGEFRFELNGLAWAAIIGLAVFSSAYAYIAQTYAQKKVSPERTGFLYALEPIFCAILAFIIFGEVLSAQEIIGAILILISLFI